MKKIWKFLGRDIVNTFILVFTIIFGVVSVIKGNDTGYFYAILALFILRFMIWHYSLWDKVNENVTDNEIRINVFGLPPLNSNKPIDHGKLYTIVNIVIFLFGIAFLIFFTISLLK